ncbi:MAG: glycosyltransferase, partial [Phycisphaerales bacterium]
GVDVRSKLRTRSCFSEQDMRRLVESLGEYALTLPEREKHALCEMLLQAMEPLDRFRYLRTSDLLSPDEEAVLRSLEKGSRRGQRPAMADLMLIVKVTRQCTLRCAYCNDWRSNRKEVMSFPVMARMIARALAEHEHVRFIWHGGEPTLLPISFYEKALLVQARLRRPEQKIGNSFQTNATKLTLAWAHFFRANNIQVGISIDGPAHLHNSHRRYSSGKGSYDHVIHGLNLLKEHEVQFSGLIVVDEGTLELGAWRLLDFLVGQGIRNFGLLPAKPRNRPLAKRGIPTSHYIEPARINVFLMNLYDAWLSHGDPNVKIRELEALKAQIKGVSARSCTLSGDCWGHYYMIEPDGSVVGCDVFSGDSRYTLGNIMHTSFMKMANSAELLQLKKEHQDALDAMKGCPEFRVCQGWCPHERYVSIRHNRLHRDDCCGLRDLITHIRNRMADEPKVSSQQALIRRKRPWKSKVKVTHRILLGPKIDLHLGVHTAFAKLLDSSFQYSKRDSIHTFVMANERQESPFRFFHWGEFADFGHGRAIVHTARWPVLNRKAWVTDTDDFVYPVMCGRHFLSPDFRDAFRGEWSPELQKDMLKRATNMLRAYAHPSCKAVFCRSESTIRDARLWLGKLGVGELGETYLSKIQVLYPAQESCPADVMEAKWSKRGPLTIVFCGRDYESKNGKMALEIFDRLSREFAKDRFVYVGNVPQQELRRHRKLPTSVVHHQSLPHKQTLAVLSAAHILFHPSKFEGLGIVFLEAAASGMAVITATGGPMRHVEELFGTGGAMLVDRDNIGQSDEASTFESYLRYLLSNPDVARSMACHNFNLATVGKLSPKRSRRILLNVYEDALERPAETPLTLGEISYRDGALLRLSSRQLEQEERDYRRELNITQSRFLL